MRHNSISHLSCLLILSFIAFNGIAYGQYQDRALERARSVKMLTDDREAVQKIFHDFNLNESTETRDDFSFGNTQVRVLYSTGDCEDSDEAVWDVVADRVVGIKIEEESDFSSKDLRVDLRSLTKEQVFANDEDQFIFHSKSEGIMVRIDGDEVESVEFFPSVKLKAKNCRNDFARDFIAEKSWFGKTKLKDRKVISCYHADVTDLSLSHNEISGTNAMPIDISTSVGNPNNDILTYNYTVTGGRIVGTGAKVKWDLSGVRSGTYTITAGVDDGCGLCGATVTKTVVVR
jgi:hypothetical protein